MKSHSVHLVGFELSIFAFIVLLNFNARTKSDQNPLADAIINGNTVAVKYLPSNEANTIRAYNWETPVHSTKLKTDKIFNLPINVNGSAPVTPGSFTWHDNRSNYFYRFDNRILLK